MRHYPSYRSGREVRVVKYSQALRAFREVVENAGRNPKEFALHSLRIGGASTLAAGGNISERGSRVKGDGRGNRTRHTRETIGRIHDIYRVN